MIFRPSRGQSLRTPGRVFGRPCTITLELHKPTWACSALHTWQLARDARPAQSMVSKLMVRTAMQQL